MPTSIVSITFFVGLALVVIALLGGGIEVKEIKIPTLPIIPRVLSFFTGCALLAVLFLRPDLFQVFNETPPVPGPNSPPQPTSPPRPTSLPQPTSPPRPTSLPQPTSSPTSPCPTGVQTCWYVMLGSFDANNGDLAVNSANRVKNQASEECHVSAQTELTAKLEGFTPGYVSSFLGPYDTKTAAAADREKVLPCVPDAYIKSIARR
jgi:hypothetical protein